MQNLIQAHPNLTVPQLRAIIAILRGDTYTEAASAAGVDRSTLYSWRNHDSEFQQALAAARDELFLSELEQLQRLSRLALNTIEKILSDPGVAPSVGLRASLAVLNRLKGTGHKGWATPQAIQEAEYRAMERQWLARESTKIPQIPPARATIAVERYATA